MCLVIPVPVDDVSKRRYERVISNLLPYRAKKAKTNTERRQFQFPIQQSFYRRRIHRYPRRILRPFLRCSYSDVTDKRLTAHYYGCTEVILASAVFGFQAMLA
jgi:hypothetical protein